MSKQEETGKRGKGERKQGEISSVAKSVCLGHEGVFLLCASVSSPPNK